MILKRVMDLRVGDLIDLEGDPYADPKTDPSTEPHPFWTYEYAKVDDLDLETDDCLRVDFENGPSCGFPIDHQVRIGSEAINAGAVAVSVINTVEALRDRGLPMPSPDVQRGAAAVTPHIGPGRPVLAYRVLGGVPRPYVVTLDVEYTGEGAHVVDFDCTCPATTACKHAVSVLASALRDGYGLKVSPTP